MVGMLYCISFFDLLKIMILVFNYNLSIQCLILLQWNTTFDVPAIKLAEICHSDFAKRIILFLVHCKHHEKLSRSIYYICKRRVFRT